MNKTALKNKMIMLLMAVLAVAMAFQPVRASAETVYVDRCADVVFVIDGTGSMQPYIDSVKTNLTSFIKTIDGKDISVRIKFVTYRDTTCGEKTVTSEWYESAEPAIAYLDTITANGGGDEPETMLDGLGQLFTSSFGFRSDAFRFCITLTDASAKMDNSFGYTCEEEVIQKLIDASISSSVITDPSEFDTYENFVTKDGGVLADITGDYSVVLKSLAESVVSGVEHLVVHEIYPDKGLVNTAQTVNVKATGVKFDDAFQVTLGGEKVTNLKQTSTGFSFTTPVDLELGSYDIVVQNGKDEKARTIGTYTYVSTEEELGYKVKKISPASSYKGVDTTMRVTVDKISYASDFKVTIGGLEAVIVKKASTYFTCKVPTTLEEGTYDIVVTNCTEKKIGKYVVLLKTLPEVTGLTPATAEEGKSVVVKAIVYEMPYESDFAVAVGGVPAAVTYQCSGYFKFRVPDTLAAGNYVVTMTNAGQTKTIGTFTVTAKPTPEPPKITGITPNQTEQGTAVVAKVLVTGLDYGADFGIKVGSEAVNVTYQCGTYFKFRVPETLGVGTYDITMQNNGTTTTIGTFTVTAKPAPEPPKITGITPNQTEEGKAVVAKVLVTGLDYGADFGIKVGSEAVNVTYQCGTYFKFRVPETLGVGTYDITMQNNGTTTTIGTFTVTAKPTPEPPKITGITPNQTEQGTAVVAKVLVTGLDYGADFGIKVGSEAVNVTYQCGTYFKFRVPETLGVGTYDITMQNNGTTTTIGTFTVTAKQPVKLPEVTKLNPTSVTVGKAVVVKAFTSAMPYDSDFSITINGESVSITYQCSSYFKFRTPTDLGAGTYVVMMHNFGQDINIGSITFAL